MEQSIGLKSVGVSVPDRVLTNDHWRRHHPQLVSEAEERIWMWKKPTQWTEGSEAFNREMAPYVKDPFRGAMERRFLKPGESSLTLEVKAATDAIEAAGLEPEDVDLLICTSFLPDSTGIGGATFLARELGLRGGAWNLESACSSGLIAFRTACSLVASGQHENVLVVTSCTYSRVTVEDDPISWGIGDAATAMVVGEVEEGAGLLGSHTVHSADTCGAVAYHLELGEDGEPYFRLRTGKTAAKLLRSTSERYLKECTDRALEEAGVELADVDHFVFNTPLAWYSKFCARALGVDVGRTLSVYPLYANVGPALLGLNLLHAAHWRKFVPGELVLMYTVGSVSSCCATVVRWGEVGLGPLPRGVTLHRLQELEARALRSGNYAKVA
jgi:3-oxoacyl-[acyl-carrier-protein] synthase-3